MNLNETLYRIAQDFQLDHNTLFRYAKQDTIGGFAFHEQDRQWPTGSIFGVEGQILHALVRVLKPTACLELGTHFGCSAAHVASALVDNGAGTLLCVDARLPGYAHDSPRLGGYRNISFEQAHAVQWLGTSAAKKARFDFIFEDLMHDTDEIEAVWRYAQTALNPGGFIISHDALHFLVGDDVRRGVERVVDDARYYLAEPADCGLAIWRKPQTTVDTVEVEAKAPRKRRKQKAKS